MRFADPYFLILLLLIPYFVWNYIRKPQSASGRLKFSDIGKIKKIRPSASLKFRHSLFVFRMITLACLILALARPQSVLELTPVYTEGVDIVLALDVSTSMRAEDLKKGENRLDVAKDVVKDFLEGRKNDRIGMVVFAANAYTQCPLTVDYSVLRQFMDRIETGMIEDGTAIGNAVANCVNRLRNSKAKSKIVILLTDGVNNRGEIDPLTSAKLAKALKVKVYTVGVGTTGYALYPIEDLFGKRYVKQPVQIDEAVLKEISAETGANYYRATDADKLENIFKEIDSLERTEIKSEGNKRYNELFGFFALPGLLLLGLEVLLGNTRFRKLP